MREQRTRKQPNGPRQRGSRTGGDEQSDGAVRGELVRSPRGEHFEVVERAGPVELQRAPPIPAEAREELLVIKDAELFLCARTDGDIAPARVSGEGFYADDTRYLSEIRLEVGGARPVALSLQRRVAARDQGHRPAPDDAPPRWRSPRCGSCPLRR